MTDYFGMQLLRYNDINLSLQSHNVLVLNAYGCLMKVILNWWNNNSVDSAKASVRLFSSKVVHCFKDYRGKIVSLLKWVFRLNYCNVLYVELPLRYIWKLQLVQNAMAGRVNSAGCLVQVILLFCKLPWFSVCFQDQCQVLVVTCKAIHGLALNGLLMGHSLPGCF